MNTKNISALVTAALLSGCVTATVNRPAAVATPHSTQAVSLAPDASPDVSTNVTRVYTYAQRGQSDAQQDRDRFECFNWAQQQTGFDPSRQAAPSAYKEQLVPARFDGATVVRGTLMGAAIGAAVANPWDRGAGAAVGAITGTALGAIAANAEASAIKTAHRQESPARSSYEQQAAEHRRAMSACLEGRGYVVK
jgi:hypothetical protein